MSQYLDSVREVERRIQKAEQQSDGAVLPDLERPATVPAVWEDHVKLMFDLQVLALQADITRVITFQLARETSTRTYPQIGVPEPHHPVSHHTNDPEKLAKLAKINAHHVSLFAYLVEKLKATPDGDGSLLDHSMYLLGSGMGNPDVHDHSNLPIVLAGGGAGKLKGARHIKYAAADAAGESPPDPAGQGRRPSRELRRQHREGRRDARTAQRVRAGGEIERRAGLVQTRLQPGPGDPAHVRPVSQRASRSHDMTRLKRLAAWSAALLLSLASVDAAGADARLVDAVKAADKAAVRALLDQRVDVNAPEADGTTALHWAANRDDPEVVDLLIRAGANVKAANRYGVTPLWLACINGNAAIVEMLLKAGADANTVLPEGETVADDGRAHGQGRRREGAARPRSGCEREGRLARANRADVGGGRRPSRRHPGAGRAVARTSTRVRTADLRRCCLPPAKAGSARSRPCSPREPT